MKNNMILSAFTFLTAAVLSSVFSNEKTLTTTAQTLYPGTIRYLETDSSFQGDQEFFIESFDLVVYGSVTPDSPTTVNDYSIQLEKMTETKDGVSTEIYFLTPMQVEGDAETEFALVEAKNQRTSLSFPVLEHTDDMNKDGMPDFIFSESDESEEHFFTIMSLIDEKGTQYQLIDVTSGWNIR